ncbi:respiratory growth induced protein 2 [Striga asiatica]|uniref:Respiratory growth induced protein 2 n=1 Tax=Striga asiatica TaxID=4170 RepID=A0A5A7RIL4_STRAF|nr:respiratory growth induced protein 2 [Striga asiatica]
MLSRWTMKEKSIVAFEPTPKLTEGQSFISRRGVLTHIAMELVDNCSLTEARSNFRMEELRNLKLKTNDINGENNTTRQINKNRSCEFTQVIQDPHPVRAKGCGPLLDELYHPKFAFHDTHDDPYNDLKKIKEDQVLQFNGANSNIQKGAKALETKSHPETQNSLRDATAATGITCTRFACSPQKSDFRRELSFLDSVLRLDARGFGYVSLVMVSTDHASSLSAFPHSELINKFVEVLPGPHGIYENGHDHTSGRANSHGRQPLVSNLKNFVGFQTRDGNQTKREYEY